MKKNIFLRVAALCVCLVLTLSAAVACSNNNTDDTADNGIFAAKYNGATVELGKKADPILEKLGKPVSEQNTGNCGGLGETIRYDYSDIVIIVVDYTDGGKKIDKIELKTDLAETTKGICIGSDKSAVIDAYGEPSETVGSTLVYKKGTYELTVGIDANQKVKTIVFSIIDAD